MRSRVSSSQGKAKLEQSKMALYDALTTTIHDLVKGHSDPQKLGNILEQMQAVLEAESEVEAEASEAGSVQLQTHRTVLADAMQKELAAAREAGVAAVVEAEKWRSEAEGMRKRLLDAQASAAFSEATAKTLQEQATRYKLDLEAVRGRLAALEASHQQKQVDAAAAAAAALLPADRVSPGRASAAPRRRTPSAPPPNAAELRGRLAAEAQLHNLLLKEREAWGREKEALLKEASKWRAAAQQATCVAEKAHGELVRLEEQAKEVQARQAAAAEAESGRQLDALRRSKEALEARVVEAVVGPLCAWRSTIVPAAAAAAAGSGAAGGGGSGRRGSATDTVSQDQHAPPSAAASHPSATALTESSIQRASESLQVLIGALESSRQEAASLGDRLQEVEEQCGEALRQAEEAHGAKLEELGGRVAELQAQQAAQLTEVLSKCGAKVASIKARCAAKLKQQSDVAKQLAQRLVQEHTAQAAEVAARMGDLQRQLAEVEAARDAALAARDAERTSLQLQVGELEGRLNKYFLTKEDEAAVMQEKTEAAEERCGW